MAVAGWMKWKAQRESWRSKAVERWLTSVDGGGRQRLAEKAGRKEEREEGRTDVRECGQERAACRWSRCNAQSNRHGQQNRIVTCAALSRLNRSQCTWGSGRVSETIDGASKHIPL